MNKFKQVDDKLIEELNITLKTPGDLINNEIEGDRETQSSGK